MSFSETFAWEMEKASYSVNYYEERDQNSNTDSLSSVGLGANFTHYIHNAMGPGGGVVEKVDFTVAATATVLLTCHGMG